MFGWAGRGQGTGAEHGKSITRGSLITPRVAMPKGRKEDTRINYFKLGEGGGSAPNVCELSSQNLRRPVIPGRKIYVGIFKTLACCTSWSGGDILTRQARDGEMSRTAVWGQRERLKRTEM